VGPDITIDTDGSTRVSVKNAEFLLNRSNKNQLIKSVRQRLNECCISNYQSEVDADALIVETAMSIAITANSIVVASVDTDVCIMLMKHVNTTMGNVFYTTMMKKGASKIVSKASPASMWWKIQSLVATLELPPEFILLTHAWGGCGTTSATYGKGKLKILKLLKSVVVQEAVSCFRDLKATHSQIAIAGNIIILRIYNGKDEDTLTSLRHADWHLMTMGKKKLKPETLLPACVQCTFIHSGFISRYVSGPH